MQSATPVITLDVVPEDGQSKYANNAEQRKAASVAQRRGQIDPAENQIEQQQREKCFGYIA